MKKIEYLVGNNNFKLISTHPYNNLICEFICDLSKILINHPRCFEYPDIKTLAFWCRKKNISIMKSNFNSTQLRTGLGLVFHITPSNVPTNFAYSLLFGLLTGNSNIIKVPSKKFEQIHIICDCIKKALKKKKYVQLKDNITIIRYSDCVKFTDEISSPSNNLIVSSSTVTITSTTDNEANLILESDTDNNDENDNPFMSFKQDGGAIAGMIGLSGDADKWPDGTTLTGVAGNAMIIGMTGSASSTNRQLYLAAGNSAS